MLLTTIVVNMSTVVTNSKTTEQREITKFWIGIATVFATIAGAAIALLGGGRATATARSGGGGVAVSIKTGLDPDLEFSKDLRIAIREAWTNIQPELVGLFTGSMSKVPRDTGLLRSSFNAKLSSYADEITLEWPIYYAQYLWDMDPQGASNQVSVAGLKRHGKETLLNWSRWAGRVAGPIIVKYFGNALRGRGYDVTTSSS